MSDGIRIQCRIILFSMDFVSHICNADFPSRDVSNAIRPHSLERDISEDCSATAVLAIDNPIHNVFWQALRTQRKCSQSATFPIALC